MKAETESGFHHYVYVVLLEPEAARHRKVLRTNPDRDPVKPCVYVGMSGLRPDERFANHKRGVKAAWVVHRYGVRLMPELDRLAQSYALRSRGSDGARPGSRFAAPRIHRNRWPLAGHSRLHSERSVPRYEHGEGATQIFNTSRKSQLPGRA